jgi:eukaryotic-like serine/threonine-protein kinase
LTPIAPTVTFEQGMDDDRAVCEQRVGTVLRGKWTVERLLGIGGMAAVYAATHKIGRREAIKILHPEVARSKDLRARFEREAQTVNKFRHPGVVEVRDIDTTEDGSPFLVMELLEGESLADRVQRLGSIDGGEMLRLVDELLDVLVAAHAQGIIHRDIKPDNLFVERNGRLKVLDFGIARMRDGVKTAMHTRAGATLGTVSYMAPEQVRGIDVDHRVDLFSVGATLFRVITKRRLHEARTESELLVLMATRPAPPLASVAPEAPQTLCAVVDRALVFDRDQRYPDARTMQEDVRAVQHGKTPPYAWKRLAAGEAPPAGAAAAAGALGPAPVAAPSQQVSWAGAAPVGPELGLGAGSSAAWDGPTMAAPYALDGGSPSAWARASQGASQESNPRSSAMAPVSGAGVGFAAAGLSAAPMSSHGQSLPHLPPASLRDASPQQGAPAHAAGWAPRLTQRKRGSKLLLVLAAVGATLLVALAIGLGFVFARGETGAETPPIALPATSAAVAPPTPLSPSDAETNRPASSEQLPAASDSPRSGKQAPKGGGAPPVTTITIEWPGAARPRK